MSWFNKKKDDIWQGPGSDGKVMSKESFEQAITLAEKMVMPYLSEVEYGTEQEKKNRIVMLTMALGMALAVLASKFYKMTPQAAGASFGNYITILIEKMKDKDTDDKEDTNGGTSFKKAAGWGTH